MVAFASDFTADFSLAGIALPGRALLAPMSGVTDHGFRRVAARFGAGAAVSEMVAADQLAAGEEEARLRAEGEGLDLHIVQLAGCRVETMTEGARVAEAAGAHVIDINMGCPAKRVTGGWSGSALMRDLDHAERLIAAVRGAVSVPVTLKTRLGWDHAALNAADLARRAEQNGVAMITVHGRTRQQFYKGRADWAAVGPVRAATAMPLVVNGDISDPESARAALRASGADAVMIGRAALGRPWLIGQVAARLAGREWREPTRAAKAAAATDHYESLVTGMGRKQGVRHARKHVAAYAGEAMKSGAPVSRAVLAGILQCESPETVLRFLAAAFGDAAGGGEAPPRAA